MITAIETADAIRDAIDLRAECGSSAPIRVNLVEFVKGLDGSIDSRETEEWLLDIFAKKLTAYDMPRLVDSILDYGMLCPLNVIRGHEGIIMGNGNHRIVAALLCGIEYIDVVVTDGLIYAEDASAIDLHSTEMPFLESEFNDYELKTQWCDILDEIDSFVRSELAAINSM